VKLLVSFDCQILNKRDFKVFLEGQVGNIKRGTTDFTRDLGLQSLGAGNVGRFSRSLKFKSVSPIRSLSVFLM
jgi:hypothetical protein